MQSVFGTAPAAPGCHFGRALCGCLFGWQPHQNIVVNWSRNFSRSISITGPITGLFIASNASWGFAAVVCHFALTLVRQVADKRSIKLRRKSAAWDTKYLTEIVGPLTR